MISNTCASDADNETLVIEIINKKSKNIIVGASYRGKKNFFDLLFQYGMISIINKPTRITKHSATAIDNIFTNSVFNNSLETGIIQTDIIGSLSYLCSNKKY